MSKRCNSNFQNFLERITPSIVVNFHTQNGLASSSSSNGKAKEKVRKPYVGLSDIWAAYDEWSSYALGVPLELMELTRSHLTHHYVPYLSAIQIFTKKPFVGGSSSRSFGTDSHLYLEYNETESFDVRATLMAKINDLATEHPGLESLTSSDLSPNSWFSVAWSPVYSIPLVHNNKALSVFFLTYHSLTPKFPETFSQEENEVGFPAFGVVTSELSGKVWNMPGTTDQQNINLLERSAVSWLEILGFSHNDFNMFMAEKSNAQLPLSRGS